MAAVGPSCGTKQTLTQVKHNDSNYEGPNDRCKYAGPNDSTHPKRSDTAYWGS